MAHQGPSRVPVRGSHLRQVSTGSSATIEDDAALSDVEGFQVATETSVLEAQPSGSLAQQLFVLSVHDDNFSKDDVILNLDPKHSVYNGDLLQLSAFSGGSPPGDGEIKGDVGSNKPLYFIFKAFNQDMLSRQPNLQVSVSRRIATAFGFEKGHQVLISTADKPSCHATHLEVVFRDQYLARADMWRLISSELANACVYRGQKIEFLGSIRAHIKTIFVQGRKVQSALFQPSTKPIFRSESARYVLFIQMSKEMWDFDAEGTGEIMFDKVINGFLPELFKRWRELKVKHLVSIVLFTRMSYEEHTHTPVTSSSPNADRDRSAKAGKGNTSKDFYRVVVSDMASGEWTDILNQLKREFKVFLRDISIRKPDTGDHLPLGEGLSSALADTPSHVIAGHPSAATRGNVLEAINLASSQFSSDYVDRDLVRTGVSIVVISPGAGVFEVDYNLLVATTDNLIENGVGIDLVCLSRMPLHSVPLFKYRLPPIEPVTTALLSSQTTAKKDENTPSGSLTGGMSSGTPPTLSISDDTKLTKDGLRGVFKERWSYGVPHWIDISFWTASPDEGLTPTVARKKPKDKSSFDTPQHKTFVPRVKMYELQMMGVMENAVSDISIPQLSQYYRSTPSLTRESVPTTIAGSPKTVHQLSMSNSLGSQGHGIGDNTPKLSTSLASARSAEQKGIGPRFQWMDEYDDLVFRHPSVAKKRGRKTRSGKLTSKNRHKSGYSPSLLGTSVGTRYKSSLYDRHSSDGESQTNKEMLKRRGSQIKPGRKKDTIHAPLTDTPVRAKTIKSTRQISFGPRGFSAKAVASTEVTTNHGEGAALLSRGLKSGLSAKPAEHSSVTPIKPLPSKKTNSPKSQQFDLTSPEGTQSSESESQQSRPIPIRNVTAIRVTGDAKARPIPHHGRDSHHAAADTQIQDRLAALQDLREHDEADPIFELDGAVDVQPPPVALSPSTTLAPWLTILNPSNPSKTKMALANRLGRWQHLFPRPLRTSQIKWKSLCSPAAVPLTTEDFPSAEQLAEEYEGTVHDVDLPENSELSEAPRSLVTEMLAVRLSRGFQIVVGTRVAESTRMASLQSLDVFDENILTESGASVFLSRGSTIHRLTRLEANKVEVKQLFRHGGETAKNSELDSTPYRPFIRSMLAEQYEPQEISIAPHRSNFDWKTIDSFISGHERPQAQDFVENLRPWRARFVLIPVEAPSSARRRQRSDEDDEEEIRLEGIRKLSQVWQRFRYVPPDERRYQAPLRNRKDTNPLDIMYQTRNPSASIAAELENVAEGDVTGRPVQLLPDSDLYQRSNFKIASLAETIQSEKGVRMLDRRWHLRLHYNCFIGFELTSWLLQNFRDVDTRDEAVDLGNELMKSGMFKHVEQRHNFRDGNYFYQIADEYRTPRPESRGWFGRGKASVPSTPMSEDMPKELTSLGRSRSGSVSNSTEEIDSTMPTGKRKHLGVALSKSLIYDVDHRKRSYRPELINLHYDRLHNPDNCYHIRVEWMNTTPRLIQDAVVSWATSVDRFGLRLVEVPIGEASAITSMHPFRAPYLVKLAKRPPEKQPQSYFDSTSFAPQPNTENNFYQKAIMRRFNFVLDFEAASDFPADVDVTYSWGKPDYRYPQYIHRSGMLIAQITDDGDFLLLANRLYNNRSAANHSHHEMNRVDNPSDSDHSRGPGFFRSSPHRGTHNPHRHSPRASPLSSPSVRATLDIPPSSSASTSTSTSTTARLPCHPKPATHSDPTRPAPSTSITTPDSTKRDFEAFCDNIEALALFYDEVLSKASSPGPNTPFLGGKIPGKGPEFGGGEGGIPALVLPGSLVRRGGGGKGDGGEKTADKEK